MSSKNVTTGIINWDDIMYISENLHNELQARLAPQLNDILLAKNGTTGIAAIVDRDHTFDIYVSLALIRIVEKIILPQYVLIAIGSSYVQNYFNNSLKGIGVPNLHLEHIRKTLIPVPPYQEQLQIIQSTNSIISLCDKISSEKRDILQLISIVKSKILTLAISGHLVPQNPEDEPSSVLLEHIRTEREELIKIGKIKRDKQETFIFRGNDKSYYEKIGAEVRCIDDEIPFEIPDSWTYVRLKHIGEIVGGGTPKTSINEYWNGNIPWLTPADMSDFTDICISNGNRFITEKGLASSSAQLMPSGTVLYSSRAPIGYTAIAANPISTNQGFKSIIPYKIKTNLYLYYCLQARTDDIIQRATGTTFKEISGSQMSETIIPLPPLNEQQAICKAIKKMMKLLSCIEKDLC